jgi:acyl-CoA synthetase (AMP-forming)/AMP-acid ligase II
MKQDDTTPSGDADRAHLPPTVAHGLAELAARCPGAIALTFAPDGGPPRVALTYNELYRAAAGIAAALTAVARRPPAPEGRPAFALIALPSGPDYVACFYACALAGLTAVTMPAPPPGARRQSYDRRLRAVLADCEPAAVIGPADLMAGLAIAAPAPLLTSADLAAASAPPVPAAPLAGGRDVALLQYSSGSTADPKGVLVGHDNLVHNVRGMAARLRSRAGEAVTSWLPLFHDMGLIGSVLHPLATGMTVHLMPPEAFLRRPARWPEVLSRTGSVMTMGPDFAYAVIARHACGIEAGSLDLSSVRLAVTGAEPIRLTTLEAVAAAYGPHGLRPGVLTPGYGLAEATLCVAASDPASEPITVRVPGTGRKLVACGRELHAGSVAVVGADGWPCPPMTEGEIWVTGPSVARGYWRRPQETRHAFRARRADGDPRDWLRTGDSGVVIDGLLCIVGRIKDVVVRGGVNVYLHDVEATASASHPALAARRAAAFAVPGSEGVVLLHEWDADTDPAGIIDRVRAAVGREHGPLLHAVALVPRGAIAHTTSGKIQRSACARWWAEGGHAEAYAAWMRTPVRVGGPT